MNRHSQLCLMAFLIATCCLSSPQSASAQFDFLRGLLGGKSQQPAQAVFQGHQQLQQATQAAEKGEIEESLKLAREAFKERGGKELFNDADAQFVGPTLLRLVKLWNEKNAPAGDVVEILRDVVVPRKPAGRVFAFPIQSQLTYDINIMNRREFRLPAPESVGAELVRWSVLAKQTEELKKRLQPALDGGPSKEAPKDEKPAAQTDKTAPTATTPAPAVARFDQAIARVIAVQLAIAEKDADTANKWLKTLIGDVKSATEQQLDYLCHAISAGLHEPKSEKSAIALLEAIAERASALPAESNFRVNASWFLVRAAELHAKSGRSEDAKRCALAVLTKPLNAQRFGADYAVYLNHVRNQQVAGALLETGAIAEGLELLTAAIDPRAARYGTGFNTFNLAVRTARELRKLAPAERYEFLRKWALPSGDQTVVRSVVDFVSPELFPNLGSGLLLDVYSTNWELVATARELGQLDELIRELAEFPVQSASVKSLRTLALVMRDGSTKGAAASEVPARLAELLAVTTKEVPPWEMANKPQPPLDTYVVAVEAALHPEWREVAELLMKQLIEHGQRTQAARIRDHFRMALIELMRLRLTSGPATPRLTEELSKQRADVRGSPVHTDWLKVRPKLWDAINFATASERMMGALPPTWFAHESYLSHVSNGAESDLCFTVPLTGSFELTVEGREGGWTEGLTGYGGVSCQIYAYNDAVYITGKGGSGYENSPKMTNLLNRLPWNRYTIQVGGNTVRHFANGQLVLEDQAGTAAPWLTLGGKVGFTPTYRNLRITGSPTIPREVALLSDARLRGWVASYCGESKPDALRSRRYIQVKVTQNNQTYSTIVEDDGTMEGEPVEVGQSQTDWRLVDGELRSARRNSFWADESPSWLSYQRPLRDGETLRYEFFHEADKATAHPTFGDVVYALGEFGNKHDAPASGRDVVHSVGANDTKTNHSLARRACAGELKDGWNTVAMSLNGGLLAIELNGQEVVTENIVATNSRRIGLFHDAAQTELRVRNVVLTGDWPKTFDEVRAAIEAPTPIEPLPNSRFLTHVIGEQYFSDNAFAVYRRAVKLETPERFQFLRRWVMPNESSDLLRMSGAFTPTHPAPPVLNEHPIDVATAEARQAVDQRLVQTGGNFVCPAILLVLAAAELDRLDELKEEVLKHPAASSPEMARGRAALLGIIALLQDQPDEALANVWECHQLVTNQEGPQYARWGDVALASLAIQHPTTRDAAFELLDRIKGRQLQASKPGTPEFARFVRQLHGQALSLIYGGVPEEFGSQPKTSQWRTVSQPTAKSRGEGYPIASFDVVAGEIAQRGGHEFDGAYFQSPLLGNYEVSCRLSHFDWRESMLMVSGIANALKYTHNEVKVLHVRPPIVELPIAKPITPKVLQWHDYKVIVKDGRFTSFVNGQNLYEEALPEQPDPWLAVVGMPVYASRAVRDIVITGEPLIPKELDLLAQSDLKSWMTDYFATDAGKSSFEWQLDDGVLTSPQMLDANPSRDRRKVENIIRYHRPMLEDGEIRYEFYYDPEVKLAAPASSQFSYLGANAPKRTVKGQSLVHPALDRMVCLIEPDGVKIHWLTDGRWDRTGLMAGNIDPHQVTRRVSEGERSGKLTDESDAERSPSLTRRVTSLKPREWNAIKFTTKGDTLTIELNGDIVFTRDIEPTNLRHFGLFHYANGSDVRVRNVRYRGDWPKTLPPIKQQELAASSRKMTEIPDAELPDTASFDFTRSKFDTTQFSYHWDAAAAAKRIQSTSDGLRFFLTAGEAKPQTAGVHTKLRLSGDFIATIEYAGLKTAPPSGTWGSGLSFKVNVDGKRESGIEARQWEKSKGTTAMSQSRSPQGEYLYSSESLTDFAESGRMRLVRRGAALYCLTAETGSDNFRLVAHRPIGTGDTHYIAIQADASDQAAGAEFLLKNMSIRATKIMKVK